MRSFLFIAAMMLAVLFFGAFGGDDNSDYPSGAPAGYTGSPGDGHHCVVCHGGSASNVTGWITSDIPVEGYTPGNSYTITVTITGSGQKGFEVSPQNVTGTLLGTLTAGANNHLVGSGKYVTQNAKVSSNPATWSFTWTAPAAGTGLVTFYGAFTVSKPVTKLSTLDVNEYIPPVPLAVIASADPPAIYPGEASQLNAEATGGTGNYLYTWTSIPPGFESDIANPVVQPAQTTKYIIEINDGVSTTSDTTEVTVNSWPTGLFDQGKDEVQVIISPNPTNGIFSIQFKNESDKEMTFVLYGISGNTMISEHHHAGSQTTLQMDISSFPKGVYFLAVKAGEGEEKIRKVVLY